MPNTKINDFSISVSTVNGSGSATANNTIHKAISKMGIPVSGRNVFPSNIQGLPTWYSIRVNDKGYLGRLEKDDIVICLNQSVVEKDISGIREGGLLIVDDSIKIEKSNSSIRVIKLPVNEILTCCEMPGNLKGYLANMVYVGVLAKILGIDLENISDALNQHFNNKKKAVEPNLQVVNAAYEWAQKSLADDYGYKLEPIKTKEGQIVVDGNTAAALGALYGGLQHAAWYPITPATGIAETLDEYIPSLRFDHEKHTTTCVVVQAEDELASIGMVVGAGWAGLRSMTATSGPGLCLMAEFLGLAYFAEVPLVVWDVQRVGPSTGLPTRTSQGDLAFAYNLSHGDTDFIILLPASVKECFEFGWKSLDIAEKFQTPVIILSDLELGMNFWISDPFEYPDEEIDRGKVIWEKDLDKMTQKGAKWGRYLDVDGDAVPYRTVPGNLHPNASYFARGTGHDPYAHYSEDPKDWEENLNRLKEKIEGSIPFLPEPILRKGAKKSSIGIVSYGSTDMAVSEVFDQFNESGIYCDYLRIRSFPPSEIVRSFLNSHAINFVIECNRDGQMKNILSMIYPDIAHRHTSISKSDGLSLSASWIIEQIMLHIKDGKNA
jgi:2-oxoglutarate/2-oxoacid ferredoxin oxidoreductase subunit alpha